MKKKKKGRPIGPIEPALVSFNETLTKLGAPVAGVASGIHGDPRQNFHAYVSREPVELEGREFGNWSHLEALYTNAMMADLAIEELCLAVVERGADPNANRRAYESALNLKIASMLLHGAVVLHLRPEATLALCGMTHVRGALESTSRAALLALGTKDEVHRWETDRLPVAEGLELLAQLVTKAEHDLGEPGRLYGWLCDFTHMSKAGVAHFADTSGRAQANTYAALAYVSWAAALVAEVVSGVPNLATYPRAMPPALPWNSVEA